jgi:hypothetical protein
VCVLQEKGLISAYPGYFQAYSMKLILVAGVLLPSAPSSLANSDPVRHMLLLLDDGCGKAKILIGVRAKGV